VHRGRPRISVVSGSNSEPGSARQAKQRGNPHICRKSEIPASWTISHRGRRQDARLDVCRVSLFDGWRAGDRADARRPGLPRLRPSAGVGRRRAQRAALISFIRADSATPHLRRRLVCRSLAYVPGTRLPPSHASNQIRARSYSHPTPYARFDRSSFLILIACSVTLESRSIPLHTQAPSDDHGQLCRKVILKGGLGGQRKADAG
jgi:hypothetical protein